MRIFADADALPNAVKEMLYRAAVRTGRRLTLVANVPLSVPQDELIDSEVVAAGPDVADKRIVELVAPGDLVITADLPLAAKVVEKGATALDPRGDLYTLANVHARLATRDLMASLREEGMHLGGPSAFRPKDRQAFANALERFLAKRGRST